MEYFKILDDARELSQDGLVSDKELWHLDLNVLPHHDVIVFPDRKSIDDFLTIAYGKFLEHNEADDLTSQINYKGKIRSMFFNALSRLERIIPYMNSNGMQNPKQISSDLNEFGNYFNHIASNLSTPFFSIYVCGPNRNLDTKQGQIEFVKAYSGLGDTNNEHLLLFRKSPENVVQRIESCLEEYVTKHQTSQNP